MCNLGVLDVTDDESDWGSFLEHLGEAIDAWNGFSRVQTGIGSLKSLNFLRSYKFTFESKISVLKYLNILW